MLRTINVFSYGISRLFGLYPKYKKTKQLVDAGKLKEAEDYLVPNYLYKALDKVLKKSGVTVDVTGLENIPKEGPFILLSNHQGNFDPIVLMYALKTKRFGFIAKKEIKKIWILKIWMEVIGCAFIDRKSPRDAIKSLAEAEKIIKGGTPMAFFPEGTRSRSSKVGTFKTGVFKIVEKVKVPVIPVAINGTYKVMEANNGKIKPANVTVTIGKQIETKDYTKEEFKELPEKVKENIINIMRPFE